MNGDTRLITTARGPARAETAVPDRGPTALLVLGHGAGGDVTAPDLTAVRAAVIQAGVAVVAVTQPYRVAGRRAPAPAAHLDDAWSTMVASMVAEPGFGGLPLLVGGRSSGARVACRTAVGSGAAGVLALAFPLHPPARSGEIRGEKTRSRAAELDTGLPTLVVNGDRDPFGVPDAGAGRRVVVLPGERHELNRDPAAVAAAVLGWLREYGWAV